MLRQSAYQLVSFLLLLTLRVYLVEPQQTALALEVSLREEAGGDPSPQELLVLEDRQVQRQGGLHAGDGELVQGPKAAAYRALAVAGVYDQLGQERVVVRGYPVAGVQVRVDPDARPPGRVVDLDQPGLGKKVAVRVLGVDPELYRVPVGRQSF